MTVPRLEKHQRLAFQALSSRTSAGQLRAEQKSDLTKINFNEDVFPATMVPNLMASLKIFQLMHEARDRTCCSEALQSLARENQKGMAGRGQQKKRHDNSQQHCDIILRIRFSYRGQNPQNQEKRVSESKTPPPISPPPQKRGSRVKEYRGFSTPKPSFPDFGDFGRTDSQTLSDIMRLFPPLSLPRHRIS